MYNLSHMEKLGNANGHELMSFCTCSVLPPNTTLAIAPILIKDFFIAIILGLGSHYF